MGFCDVFGCVNAVLQADEDAHAFGHVVSSSADGGEDIFRAVSREFGSSSHGACDADWFFCFQGHVEEECGFFQGIGPMGDDEAVCFPLFR